MNDQNLQELFASYMPVFIFLIVWELTWKLIALWKAARNNQPMWFVCLAIINTAGILPIIYILTHRTKSPSAE